MEMDIVYSKGWNLGKNKDTFDRLGDHSSLSNNGIIEFIAIRGFETHQYKQAGIQTFLIFKYQNLRNVHYSNAYYCILIVYASSSTSYLFSKEMLAKYFQAEHSST